MADHLQHPTAAGGEHVTARVTVVGLGKIGLPLAVQFASRGMAVTGADISPAVVASVREGRAPFPGEPRLEQGLAKAIADGLFDATTDTAAAVRRSDVVVIVVPLVVDHDTKEPHFAAIDAATAAVAKGLRPGTLVCYETTLPLRTTRDRFAPALATSSGLTLGSDLFVCFSPERVSSGSVFRDLARYPKLVGGIDDASAKRAVAFYVSALSFDERVDLDRPNGVWDLGSAEAAEMAKLAETTYRDINIAFANELAMHCDALGVDVGRVITASNSQPYSHIHQPGVAVGGHCIPVYPHLYLRSDPKAQMPMASRTVNDRMPAYCVGLLQTLYGALAGARVAVLGLAYRGGVKETAFSGAWALVEELRGAGATPLVEDPLFDDDELRAYGLTPYHFGETVDAAIVQCDHRQYRDLDPSMLPGIKAIVDGRNVVAAIDAFGAAGATWHVLGRRGTGLGQRP